MSAQHDEQYFLGELVRLFDPDRIYRKFGGFGEDEFVEEIRQYYQGLSPEDQQVFEQAVLRWLRSGDSLRRMQAIRLCGDLKLKGCVDDLLRLGESLRRESPNHKDLNWIVQALGPIGEAKALDFLVKEAMEGEYRNGALVSISEINLNRALQLMPVVIGERWQANRDPDLTEWLFCLFLDEHRGQIAQRLGVALSQFSDKAYLLERFRNALHNQGYDADGKWLGKRDKQRLLHEFQKGLEQR